MSKDTTVVFRIEHISGFGVFRAHHCYPQHKDIECIANLNNLFRYMMKMHTPGIDGISLGMPSKYGHTANIRYPHRNAGIWFCGFKSKTQLLKCITRAEIETLKQHNYRILELEVDEWQTGNQQVAYTKKSVKRKQDITQWCIDNAIK